MALYHCKSSPKYCDDIIGAQKFAGNQRLKTLSFMAVWLQPLYKQDTMQYSDQPQYNQGRDVPNKT